MKNIDSPDEEAQSRTTNTDTTSGSPPLKSNPGTTQTIEKIETKANSSSVEEQSTTKNIVDISSSPAHGSNSGTHTYKFR